MPTESTDPPPHVLVAGFGYVGKPLSKRLVSGGVRVTGASRSGGQSADVPGITVEACDIADRGAVEGLAARIGAVDAIIHCASSSGEEAREEAYRAVYLEGCRNLLAVFEPKRFVFTGSTSVYAQTDGSVVDEDCPAEPSGATGTILRETERTVLGAGHLVARLAGIYGPGRSFLLKRFLEGAASIDGKSDEDAGRWINQIHREDAARALAMLALSEFTGEAVFNVCDDTPFLQRPFYERLAAALGSSLPPTRPPNTGRKRGWTHKQVSNARLRGLGWAPCFPSYFDALAHDPALLPSIRSQLA